MQKVEKKCKANEKECQKTQNKSEKLRKNEKKGKTEEEYVQKPVKKSKRVERSEKEKKWKTKDRILRNLEKRARKLTKVQGS